MAHTPGPWTWNGDRLECLGGAVIEHDSYEGSWFARYNDAEDEANKALIAAAPDMLAALKAVNKLVAEAAMTGFNWQTGDWTERLYASQQDTSNAIAKAEGRNALARDGGKK
jgi:hypothetical protein